LQISEMLGKRLAFLSMVRSMAVRSQSKLIQQGICWNRMRQKASIAGNLVRPKMAHLIKASGSKATSPNPVRKQCG
jgi:hypothetical protein